MRATADFAALRSREFARLDRTRTAYLDYAGAALYPESLVRHEARRLSSTVFGNPHSESGPSLASTAAMERARQLTLEFVNADPGDYEVIFTANATGAIRILAESFPFARGSRLVLTSDNHNSVNGLRTPARRAGATVEYVPLAADLRSASIEPWLRTARAPSLVAFPAQSNFSGVHHPLAWVAEAQRRGYRVLLDAAAYIPTSRLDLTATPADFVALSYYKIFGYPTGVGALIVRKDASATLARQYFAGGTVQFASVQNDVARLVDGPGAFEDGTVNFLAMPAVCDGLCWINRLVIDRIAAHVRAMTSTLLDALRDLGDRVIVYGPRDMHERGGVVAFNVIRGGRAVPYEDVEHLARARSVSIRGGCFCNPGAAERAFDIDAASAAACYRDDFSVSRFRRCLGGSAVGALRASVGVATEPRDIDRLHDLLIDIP
jgi:selenocysteine lyase/cysteine desulfurase